MNTLDFDYPRKKEEIILTFPQSLFNGKVPDIPTLASNCMWMSRDMANANTDLFRQAATYSIIFKMKDGQPMVAMYSRESGDGKLTGMLSIGYGGHPEIIDLLRALHDCGGDFSAPMTMPLFKTLIKQSGRREIDEELKLDWQMVEDASEHVEHHLPHPIPLVEYNATVEITYAGDETPNKVRVKVNDEVPVVTSEEDGDIVVMHPAGDLKVGDVIRYYGDDTSVTIDRTVTSIKKNDIGTYHVGFVNFIQVHPLTIASSTNPNADKFIGWVSLEELETYREECRLENWSASAVSWIEALVNNPKFEALVSKKSELLPDL